MAAVGVTNYASGVVTYLPLLGMMTGGFGGMLGDGMGTYLWIMAIGWGIIMFFNLATLPVEFDASTRAKKILSGMRLVTSEAAETGVRKTLDAAAMTYVAAFITSLMWMLWHILPLLLGRRN